MLYIFISYVSVLLTLSFILGWAILQLRAAQKKCIPNEN